MPGYLVVEVLQGVLLFLLSLFLIAVIILSFSSAIFGTRATKYALKDVVAAVLDRALLALKRGKV